MASTRLPGKPLADIAGMPMIVHVMRRGLEADIGPVAVACAEPEIAAAVEAAGGRAVLTEPGLPSGSDRVFAALRILDPDGAHDIVINLQGDLPTIAPAAVRACVEPLGEPGVDISTLVAPARDEDLANPNVDKVALSMPPGATVGRAIYFSRNLVPHGEGPWFHHIGIYGYRRAALERFVGLPVGVLEARERLEQLRALENGMRIDAALVDTIPHGVDTPADLERARAILARNGGK
jgi:3-deoxy-manno-octulosonate cytidylyltransferase (CMP-KDO synthetase)